MSNLQRLFLLRHAEAEPASLEKRDFDRPLSDKGKIDAQQIGKIIKEHYKLPEAVVLSPSKRTKQTVNLLHLFDKNNLNIIDDLYNGDGREYLNILKSIKDAQSLLLVAHNPAIFILFQFLTSLKSKIKIPHSYPPAGLAIIDFPNEANNLKEQNGQLVAFYAP